jgi:uncharacterized protein YjbI with pentapeptide repeats
MNPDHLKILQQGIDAWDTWREEEFSAKPDLSGADLIKANLSKANLMGVDFREANLNGANLSGANFGEANLSYARLTNSILKSTILKNADLYMVDLRGAILSKADLTRANLSYAILTNGILNEADLVMANINFANLSGANLSGANLRGASLVEANIKGADFTGCYIYGISAWGLKLDEHTKQQNLVFSPYGKPDITVDNLEVAQFVYLLLNNEKIRDVIDTITTKVVLILGRFAPERKAVLDAMRDALRERDLLPIIFDFSIPASRDVTETVKVLAGLARFVIADITDATEVRAELHNIVPDFTKLPVQPILLRGKGEFVSLPGHLMSYPWMLPTFEYDSQEQLIARLDEVIRPAQAKVLELRGAQPR